MKKIVIISLFALIGLPAFSACDFTSSLCIPSDSILAPSDVKGRYAPDRLDSIVKPTPSRQPYHAPFDGRLINTDSPQQQTPTTTPKPDESSYNSNCQFGICLPGSGMTDP